jgi:hypothetical protein
MSLSQRRYVVTKRKFGTTPKPMFLRWARYRDKDGRTRLYARLVGSWREGRKVRQRTVGSLRVSIQAGVEWPDRRRRDFWNHLDNVLERHCPSPSERANIERAFAAELGERPPPTALEKTWRAVAVIEPKRPF